MPSSALRAGDRVGPFDLPLGPELVRQFAAATLDAGGPIDDGLRVPAALVATLAYRPQLAAITELVPADVFASARSGVHGQHELLLHRPVTSDERLRTFVETHSARPSGDKLVVTLHHSVLDPGGDLVAEQWWTTVLLGTTAGPIGPGLPDRSFHAGADATVVAEDVVRIDEAMALGYARVSGDFSDHHFTVDGARRSGVAAPFLHGLCTMALCARAVVRTACDDDPSRLQRFALQFASPAYLDQDLTVRICHLEGSRYAFEATCGDAVVIRSGFAVLRSSG